MKRTTAGPDFHAAAMPPAAALLQEVRLKK
jgi:hypothetical protein